MQITITAVGPDHQGLADPIIHYATGQGANISEIQMFDHDERSLFAMLARVDVDAERLAEITAALTAIGRQKDLSVRVWTPPARSVRPRLAIATTYRQEPALALLRAIRDGRVRADVALMVGNRPPGRSLAEQFDVPWHMIGNARGEPDNGRMVELCDAHKIDYLILARYMRVLPAEFCWKFAGGRIVNLHHGLLPSFPGMRPYHEAHAFRMLTFGATCHFIVPALDAGNQIIYQSTFTVPPGIRIDEIVRRGQEDNEPHCLVEGVRRVVDREVTLHFNRVVAG
ncbi:MAG: formyltransferase family protein [Pirellulales bacterium]